jgi:hypothetical protein
MNRQPYRRKTALLIALIAVAAAHGVWFHYRDMLTGNPTVDGTFSVLLGLYICSRPAANAIDLFFFERGPFHRVITEGSSIGWLALNVLALVMGWTVIHLGAIQLASRPS